MTDKGIRTISDELQSLYRPQTDQLGMKLHHRAGGLEGRVNNRTFRGRVWVSAVDPYCLVVWHDLIFSVTRSLANSPLPKTPASS